MNKFSLFFILLLSLSSCGVKQTQQLVSNGNYDEAINNALANLRTNKDKKGKQDYIYLLEEAFAKAKERDLNNIQMLKIESNPNQIEKLYNYYVQLHDRQEKIKPILPLFLIKEGRNAIFPFDNYNSQIVSSKNALAEHLYTNAIQLIKTNTKVNFRNAFDALTYLNKISPNYKEVNRLLDEAKFKGTDFVLVKTKNETNMIIPERLQTDLLDFSTYRLNNPWIVYHNAPQKGTKYDFSMMILFRNILVSPEQIKEREFIKERDVKDGYKKVVDANGKVVLDEKGKEVMVDNFKKVTIQIYEYRQLKTCQVAAKVEFITTKGNQLLQSYPVSSEFVFENIYATYKGDRRATEENYFPNFDRRAVLFPSTEQMIFDTGEDLKSKIKEIMNTNHFE
ncbi:hypothetical protein [Flavobacterium sp. TSSA_36]|uniref:hypothetical protein n=1 Tax=Flavobacterium sp. TSSA_36 TaxID=3447669 RepID=UPI003F30D376